MRVISGKLKGRVYNPPKNFRARPTTDFAKENLFNVLNNRIDWEETEALDLFGGTGGISFELVSRGCKRVVCVEKDFKHAEFIEKTRVEFKLEEMSVMKLDAFKYLEYYNQKFDLIFIDPPYDLKNFDTIPKLVFEKEILAKDGLFILEHSSEYNFSDLPQYSETRSYGSVNFTFFENI